MVLLDIPNNMSKHIVSDFYYAIGGGRHRDKQDAPKKTNKPPSYNLTVSNMSSCVYVSNSILISNNILELYLSIKYYVSFQIYGCKSMLKV